MNGKGGKNDAYNKTSTSQRKRNDGRETNRASENSDRTTQCQGFIGNRRFVFDTTRRSVAVIEVREEVKGIRISGTCFRVGPKCVTFIKMIPDIVILVVMY